MGVIRKYSLYFFQNKVNENGEKEYLEGAVYFKLYRVFFVFVLLYVLGKTRRTGRQSDRCRILGLIIDSSRCYEQVRCQVLITSRANDTRAK